MTAQDIQPQEGQTKRIFIAVNLPDVIKKEIYEKFCRRVPKQGAKAVEEPNLHITMRFMGGMGEEALQNMIGNLQALKQAKLFAAKISGLGHFNYRVLWIGVGQGAEEFENLNKIIESAIGKGDERFHPHVTIARNKGMRTAEFRALFEKLEKGKYSAEFEVKSIDVMQSLLSPKGPEYRVVERIMLA